MDKANLILNSTIELVDIQGEGNGKGRPFISRFIEPGIAHYKELGDILITKETLNKFIHTMVGCPVIIEHEDVTDENANKLRVGVVSRVWFSEMDGYFYCEGILTDPEAIDLVKNQGYNVSCAYSFVSDNTKRTHNGKEIDMEFIDGEFLHLALVKDPRYEGANIVVNKNDDDLEWITVKGNHIPVKKGQSKEEAIKEFLKDKETNVEPVQPALPTPQYPDKQRKEQEPSKKDDKGNDDFRKLLEPVTKPKQLAAMEETKDYIKEQVGIDITDHVEPKYTKDWGKGKFIIVDFKRMHKTEQNKIKGLKNLQVEEFGDWAVGLRKVANSTDKENVIMQVLNDLKDFIKSVVSNEKENEMKEVKNEDKRKLIDEVGGILKGKVDDEIIRTVIGKLEKVAYEPSEDNKADNKAKNEDDEEKEAENKCKNEEEEKEEKVEEKEEKVTENEDEEDKEDKAENKKVKNSMKDIVMGGSSQVQTQKLYTSRKERLEEGNKY